MKRSILFTALGAVALLGLAATASQAARTPLFSASKTAAGITGDISYRALADNRATESLQIVRADAGLVSAKTDVLPLGLGDFGNAYRQYSKRNADGTEVWYGNLGKQFGVIDTLRYKATGEIADDPNNSVMIVRNGDKLTGTIRSKGQLYSLRPLRSGGHAIVRSERSEDAGRPSGRLRFPAAHRDGQTRRSPRAAPASPPARSACSWPTRRRPPPPAATSPA